MNTREAAHHELPRTDRTPHPHRYLLHPLRPLARWIIRRRLRVRLHGTERVPRRGPVVFAANHVGISDGPLLAIFAPRPVHALTKLEMFDGALGTFLLHSGQIPLYRLGPDPSAVRACVRVLREGGTVGIFPEGRRGSGDMRRFHRGAAYLALVAGASVVPVTFFGTRDPGGASDSIPPRGRIVDVVFGEPYRVERVPWPRTKEHVRATSVLLWQHMRAQLDAARSLTGRELPGPLPVGDLDPDPATGITDVGAP
ncbi:lysophospholipid acyltransferase family protein [Nocardioides acrostichi]|uniref:1-acyl-sn-glycerol-3-phosphate acyltransferase n=1 Tax=Nocardioides acrostichi TaxID=2784339 RepID=A0A930UZK0_9ACTN|nr:lysophospholipid acyltransferase family protein [Nocardioides acrostichi]MBF4163803.1 1-acyl-sn-glycerol-3-phosphate acyltransferase [Nocardioides acrostichi]